MYVCVFVYTCVLAYKQVGPSTTVLVSCAKRMTIAPSHPHAKNYWCANSTDLDANTVLAFKGTDCATHCNTLQHTVTHATHCNTQ